MPEQKNAWQEIKEIVARLGGLRKIGRFIFQCVTVGIVLWMVAGFGMPYGFQRVACANEIEIGKAPTSFWRWHPWIIISENRGRKLLLEDARSRLAPGQDLAQSDLLIDRLAWASAILPNDGELQSELLLLYSIVRPSFVAPPGTLIPVGLAAVALRAKGSGSWNELALASSSCGIMEPAECVWTLEATRQMDHGLSTDMDWALAAMRQGVLVQPEGVEKLTTWVKLKLKIRSILLERIAKAVSEGKQTADEKELETLLRQREAFERFLYRPNEFARRVKSILEEPSRRDYERIRLAELAIVSSWLNGAAGAHAVLSGQMEHDAWIAAFSGRLESVNWLKGLKGQEFGAIWTTCRGLVTPWHAFPLVADQVLPKLPDLGFKRDDPNFEGTAYQNDQTKERISRVEIEKYLADLKSEGRVLVPFPSIPPLTDEHGCGSALGSTVAYLATQMACEVPEPVFSVAMPYDSLDELGAWQPSTVWDSDRKHWLQLRMDSPNSLQGSLTRKAGRWLATVQLVNGKFKSAKVSKTFDSKLIVTAPKWLAETAYKLTGHPLSPRNAAALKAPWLGSGRDLVELSDILTSLNLDVNRAKRYRQLFEHCKSEAILRYGDFYSTREGLYRRDLLPKVVEKEPWRVYGQCVLADWRISDGYCISGLLSYLKLLKGDMANSYYLQRAVTCLENSGMYAEADELTQICLEASHGGSNQLILAANSEISRAWQERGGGWGKTVRPWGWDNVEMGTANSTNYALQGLSRTPEDVRFTARLIELQRDGGSEDQCAALFDRGRKQEHCYQNLYWDRMEFLKAKWHGSDDAMFDFARRWKDEDPGLLIAAHQELARTWNDKGTGFADKEVFQKNWLEYFSRPGNWEEARESYWINLRKNPRNIDSWEGLFSSAVWAGKEGDELEATRKFFDNNPKLAGLRDYVTFRTLDAIAAEKTNMQNFRGQTSGTIAGRAGVQFLIQEPIWKEFEKAYRTFIVAHPGNDLRPNQFARDSLLYGKKDSARWAFAHIKNWEEVVWTREEYSKARLLAAQ